MSGQNYTTSFTVDQTPQAVFDAINNVRGWWSGTFQITELVAGRKVVWHCLDNHFNFVEDESKWKDTDVVFEIARKGDKTELRLPTSGWCRPTSATAFAPMPGVRT